MSQLMANSAGAETQVYEYPPESPASPDYRARVNGQQAFVYHTAVADFLAVTCAGPCVVELEVTAPVSAARVRPVQRGIPAEVNGQQISFRLPAPGNVCVEVEQLLPLFVFINPPETDIPHPDDPLVQYFHAGKVYDAGDITLHDGETLYIEGGAVVRGLVRARGAKNIRLRGRGILDGDFPPRARRRQVVLEECAGILVEDLILLHPTCWMLVLGASRDIIVRNLKEIGEVSSSDGIDIVGSHDVLIEGCFLRNNDDCVVVKALHYPGPLPDAFIDWRHDVYNVLVRDCVLLNDQCGNAMEIGHELRTGAVYDITFRDCDVLSVHGHNAVFGIHNADCAAVHDILFEDIRVEHCYDKLIEFRVLASRYSHEPGQGSIHHVTLRNIHWQRTPANAGYTTSQIGGFDAAHLVTDILIDHFYLMAGASPHWTRWISSPGMRRRLNYDSPCCLAREFRLDVASKLRKDERACDILDRR